jgi:enoyl-CoA hydratase/carnithine racemase
MWGSVAWSSSPASAGPKSSARAGRSLTASAVAFTPSLLEYPGDCRVRQSNRCSFGGLGLSAGESHYPEAGSNGEEQDMIEITDDGAVRVLALNRPEVLNAFSGGLFDALVESLLEADADDSVSVVVITGAGRAFTAGADLSEMGQRAAPPKHGFAGLCETLIAYGKPVIVAANGASVGVGGTIMGLVDVVYVADSAKVRCPFAALGINPEAGSSLTFPALMGAQKAAWFLYSAEVLDAGACVEAGLALEQLPDEGFMDHVLQRARTLASKAPNSLRETKELLWAPRRDALRAAMAAENEALTRTIGSAENKEAIAAFQEKRAPDFRRSA